MRLHSFVLLIVCLAYLCQSKLLQALVYFRHGARYHTNTVYDGNSTYPVRGQLTSIGMRMMQNLGKLIRQQYIQKIPLLNTTYNISQIQIFSTRYDRTMQSGISFMYGLYPSGSGPKLPYVDRPFHLPPYSNKTDIDQQNFALPNGHQIQALKFDDKVILKDCNNWDQLINKSIVANQIQYQEMNSTYLPFLKKMTGLFFKNQTNIINFAQSDDLFSTLHVDRYLGKALPSTLVESDYQNLNHLSQWYYALTLSKNLSNLINTYKIKKILSEFQTRTRIPSTYSTKMSIMSVHDTDIASLLTFLNITSSQCIQQKYRKGSTLALNCQSNIGFASNIIIQLHTDDGIAFYVKIRVNGKYVYLCQKKGITCDWGDWRGRIKLGVVNNVEDICKH